MGPVRSAQDNTHHNTGPFARYIEIPLQSKLILINHWHAPILALILFVFIDTAVKTTIIHMRSVIYKLQDSTIFCTEILNNAEMVNRSLQNNDY